MKKLAIFVGIGVVLAAGLYMRSKGNTPVGQKDGENKVAGGEKTLHLFIWANYIDPEVYKKFEEEFGVKIVEDNFDSNEMLRSRLQVNPEAYDLIVPSDFMIKQLVDDGLLAELHMDRIPNRANLAPEFKELGYDPGHNHVVPYLWGTVGIGYRSDKVQSAPTSWNDYLAPEKVQGLGKRISMLDSPREALGVALKLRGFSVNTKNPDEIAQAKQILLAQKPHLGRYDSETFDDFLVSGDLDMALAWSGEIAKAAVGHPEVKYVVPTEGSIIWADNLAVPKGAKNQAAAEDFINFIHRPEISAQIVNFIHYPSPNDAAKKGIKPEILNDTNLYPTADMMAKFEWLQDVGEANALYEQAWAEVKGSSVN